MTRPWFASLAGVLHRWAQKTYSRQFRHRHAPELQALFEARLAAEAARGSRYAIWAALVGIADALVSGTAEHVERFRGHWPDSRLSLDSITGDVKFALRLMRRSPLFTAMTLLVLGIGIGANGAVFAVVEHVLLRPLPYVSPDRLVMIWSNNTNTGERHNSVSPADFADFRSVNRTFESVEAMQSFLVPDEWRDGDARDQLDTLTVSAGMFRLLGRDAFIGRTFNDQDREAVVLSYGFWQRRYGGDRSIVGRRVGMTGGVVDVIGIMPPDFVFPYRSMLGPSGFVRASTADVWLPMIFEGRFFRNSDGSLARQARFLGLIGRLRPDATLAQANGDLSEIARRLAEQYPDANRGWSVTSLPLHDQTVGAVKAAIWLLFGSVSLVLLMACINVVNLLLTRSLIRQRELAVRTALGASRARLTQQALIESLMLALAGGAVGALLLYGGIHTLVALAPPDTPRLGDVSADRIVLLFTMAVSVLTGLAIAILPALSASRHHTSVALRDAGRGAVTTGTRQRLRNRLVIAQLTLTVLLAVGSALLLRSFVRVINVDPGFRAERLLTFQINIPPRYTTSQARLQFYDELFERLQRIQGVVKAGGTTRLPLGSTNVSTLLQVEGRDVAPARLPEVELRRALHDYFDAMSIPILRGRSFSRGDTANSPGVVVINRALERRVFPGEDPIGRRVRLGTDATSPPLTIIGVIGDVRHANLEEVPRPEIYIAARQGPPVAPYVVLRTTADAGEVAAAVRREIRALDPATPIYDLRTMREIRRDSVSERRFLLLLIGTFGVMALALAAVGVYGVMALLVSERTAEVGLRLTLGARPSQILTLVLGRAGRLSAIGILIGLAAAGLLAPLSASHLFGISALDPVTFVSVPLLLFGVTLGAAYIPARRAMLVDPAVALRE